MSSVYQTKKKGKKEEKGYGGGFLSDVIQDMLMLDLNRNVV